MVFMLFIVAVFQRMEFEEDICELAAILVSGIYHKTISGINSQHFRCSPFQANSRSLSGDCLKKYSGKNIIRAIESDIIHTFN